LATITNPRLNPSQYSGFSNNQNTNKMNEGTKIKPDTKKDAFILKTIVKGLSLLLIFFVE
jgi:hypothetical protein